ncbi:MAG: DNA repair protein RadC [Proteobacteria bacterium]|nr:DNA repair protein RadC [Desulfobacula sp.]MBU3950586.1 DNA repair protein RadC [Pseudomonadota bacterium]
MEKKQFWASLKSGEFASMVKESSKGKQLFSPKDVFNVMKPIFAEKDDVESMYCVFLNTKNRVIAIEKMFEGTINHSIVYPREIIKLVILLKATAVILIHNHPTGDPEPSSDDKKITMKVGISLWSMDVKLHDHIIVGDSYHSMADSGYIQKINTRMKEILFS